MGITATIAERDHAQSCNTEVDALNGRQSRQTDAERKRRVWMIEHRPAGMARRAAAIAVGAALAAALSAEEAWAAARAAGDLIAGSAVALEARSMVLAGNRVRIWGIDVPQAGSYCFRNGAKWKPAADATAGLRTCLGGKTVTCRVQRREWYWLRPSYVAECWTEDGQDIGDCMVQAGWATDYTCYSDGYYQDRETEARNKGVGLWACDNGPPTRRWGRRGHGAACESPPYKPSGPAPR
jgi:endonuclease YncB( thermonuclease family)